MAKDIMARLQEPDIDLLWRDAAAEIERLRDENAHYLKALNEIAFDLNLTGSGRALVAREAIASKFYAARVIG